MSSPSLNSPPTANGTTTAPAEVPSAYKSVHSLFERRHTPNDEHWLRVAREVSAEFAQTVAERYRKRGKPHAQIRRLHESGLASVLIREEAGGGGCNWALGVEILREISAGDGSLGVLLMHHLMGQYGIRNLSEPARSKREAEIVRDRHWVGNGGANMLENDLVAESLEHDRFHVHGRKTFCTGGAFATRLNFRARRTDNQEYIHGNIAPDHPGVTFGNDWDALGLPLADSGSITYDVVLDPGSYRLGGPESKKLGGGTVLDPLAIKTSHLGFSNCYLGNAVGALRTAREYIQTTTRPWVVSGVARAADDPYIIQQFGEFWAQVEAAIAVGNRAADLVQTYIDAPRDELTEEARGHTAIAIATFKILATRASVDISSKIFELTGARSIAGKYGFDRFWRDARTYTLHNPVSYKVKEVGDYALNGRFAEINFWA